MKLFFLPHAGGSARGYMFFRNVIDKDVEIYPLEIAGRGQRTGEKCFDDVKLCVEDIFEKYKEQFKKEPYAIFAHSMGTVLAWELVKIIEKNNYRKPEHIFFSGKGTPFCKADIGFNRTDTSDENVLKFLKEFGGLPDIVINNKELLKMTLPIVKKDIIMVDSYTEEKGSYKLDCDISIMYGKDDNLVKEYIGEWQECTTKKCEFYSFEGGHFYYKDNKKDVANIINNILHSL